MYSFTKQGYSFKMGMFQQGKGRQRTVGGNLQQLSCLLLLALLHDFRSGINNNFSGIHQG